jgi:hypothetical protein
MVAVSGLLTLIASPIVLPVLYLADLVSGHWRGRLVRYWLLAGAVVWTEITGVIAATAIGLWFANGRRNPSGWMAANYRIECWWGRRHYRNLNIFAGVSIELDNPDILHGPPGVLHPQTGPQMGARDGHRRGPNPQRLDRPSSPSWLTAVRKS